MSAILTNSEVHFEGNRRDLQMPWLKGCSATQDLVALVMEETCYQTIVEECAALFWAGLLSRPTPPNSITLFRSRRLFGSQCCIRKTNTLVPQVAFEGLITLKVPVDRSSTGWIWVKQCCWSHRGTQSSGYDIRSTIAESMLIEFGFVAEKYSVVICLGKTLPLISWKSQPSGNLALISVHRIWGQSLPEWRKIESNRGSDNHIQSVLLDLLTGPRG